jgi:hypothetical protein
MDHARGAFGRARWVAFVGLGLLALQLVKAEAGRADGRGKELSSGEVRCFQAAMRACSVAFSPDGRLVLAGGSGPNDAVVCLWDTDSGRQLHRFSPRAFNVLQVGFSGDGRRVFASGDHRLLYQAWSPATGRECQVLNEPGEWLAALVERWLFGPVPTADAPGAEAKDSEGQAMIHEMLRPWYASTLAISPDGRRALSMTARCSPDRERFRGVTLRVWDLGHGRELRRFDGPVGPDLQAMLEVGLQGLAHLGTVWRNNLKSSIRGQRVGPAETAMPMREAESPKPFYRDVPSPPYWCIVLIACVQSACDGSLVAFVGRSPGGLMDAMEGWPQKWALSTDGSTAVSGSDDGCVRVWDLDSGRLRRRFGQFGSMVACVALSADGRLAACGRTFPATTVNLIEVWEVETGRLVHTLRAQRDRVTCVAFSPDGRRILSGSDDGSVRLWDSATGQQRVCFQGQQDSVTSVAFSPDGRFGLCGGGDSSNPPTGKCAPVRLLRLPPTD